MSELIVGYAISNKSGTTCQVSINGVTNTVDVLRDVSVSANDPVLLDTYGNGRYVVIGRLGNAAVVAPPDPTPIPSKPVVTTGIKSVSPVQTISRQGSRWRNDNDYVYQGEYGGQGLHTGCAFFGNGFAGVKGSEVTKATLKVKRLSKGGITAAQDTTLWLLSEKYKPSGAPTRSSSIDGPNLRWGESTTFGLPNSWAQQLVDGTAGGIAIYEADGSPYVILAGKSEYSASFTVTINWRRTS